MFSKFDKKGGHRIHKTEGIFPQIGSGAYFEAFFDSSENQCGRTISSVALYKVRLKILRNTLVGHLTISLI